MSTAPSCLILTPTRGQSPWLAATVESVAAAAAPVRHIVICPPAEKTAVAAAAPRATVIAQSGEGLYRALNDGLKAGGDDWDTFTWINDDDLLCPAGFAQARAMLADDPLLDVVFGRVGLIGSDGRDLGALPVAHHPDDLAALFVRGIMPLAQPGTLIRRKIAEKLGGLDESFRLAGDLDFFVRALGTGARFAFVDHEVARFRLTAAQLSRDEARGEAEKARALEGLRSAAPSGGLAALLRFRWANRGVYLDRIRRHGFVSMRTLSRQT
jgi:hypothetical protein